MNNHEAHTLERQITTLLGDDELGLLTTEESPHLPGHWGVTIKLTAQHDWLTLADAALRYHPDHPPDDEIALELRVEHLEKDVEDLTAERDAYEAECDSLQEDLDWEKGINHDLRAEAAALRTLLDRQPVKPIDRWLAEARAHAEAPPPASETTR